MILFCYNLFGGEAGWFAPFSRLVILNTLFFTGVLPTIPILYLIHKGKISDYFISDRRQRFVPFVITIICYLAWAGFMYLYRLPMFIVHIAINASILIAIITIITQRWKISVHLTTMGGFVGAIFGACYHQAINPVAMLSILFVLSGALMMSRIKLKAHTPMQTVAGFLLGLVTTFAVCLIP